MYRLNKGVFTAVKNLLAPFKLAATAYKEQIDPNE